MIKDWKKEVKPKLEKIAEEEGGKLTERVLDYKVAKNMLCLTCDYSLSSTRGFTLPTDDPEIFRWLCETCGDNVINYYMQIHFPGQRVERKIMTMSGAYLPAGGIITRKVEICFAFFGERYCNNCVYETESKKGKGKVLDKSKNELDEKIDISKDYKQCILSSKLLESNWSSEPAYMFTNVCYMCVDCAKEYMKYLRESGGDIINVEENQINQFEARVEEMAKKLIP